MEYVDGNERRFGAEDLFFSTTDTKGVIRRTNRVFNSLSRYSSEELVGSPHNIIRHDDMPAGAFKLMWDELEQGRCSCVYVLNRAKDGRVGLRHDRPAGRRLPVCARAPDQPRHVHSCQGDLCPCAGRRARLRRGGARAPGGR